MTPKKATALFTILQQANPNPTTELTYNNPFELLVSVILSAQATDISVNKATAPLYAVANSPQAILDLGEAQLKHYIRTIGLFNTKAKNILRTCEMLVVEHNGQVPRSRTELEALPGVGRKTANVVLNTLYGEPTMAVDTHIFRVSNRIGLAKAKTPLAVEKQLLDAIPEPFLKDAHHWLILHGRYTCTARKPKCPTCPIREYCAFKKKTAF